MPEISDAEKRRLAFITGYHHGIGLQTHASRREVEERFPKWSTDQIDAYLNGRDDGVAGDHTRYVALRDLRL